MGSSSGLASGPSICRVVTLAHPMVVTCSYQWYPDPEACKKGLAMFIQVSKKTVTALQMVVTEIQLRPVRARKRSSL